LPRIFDVHVHYPAGFGPMGRGQEPEKTPQQRVDELAERLHEAGVVKACLLSGTRFVGFGVTHEEAIKTMEPHRDLFVPVAVVDPGTHTPQDLDRLHGLGYRGLKIIGTAKEYDDESYFPVYGKAEELGMPILFHLGVIGGGVDYARTHPRRDPQAAEVYQQMMERLNNPPAPGSPGAFFGGARNVGASRMRPFHLDTIASNFPKLRLIGAHLGGTGNYDETASVARWRHFVFFDLSGGEIIERHAMERGYIGREIGVEKLVWGSDCRPDEILTHVRRVETMFAMLNLTPDEQERVWYRNAAEIYRYEKPVFAGPGRPHGD